MANKLIITGYVEEIREQRYRDKVTPILILKVPDRGREEATWLYPYGSAVEMLPRLQRGDWVECEGRYSSQPNKDNTNSFNEGGVYKIEMVGS